MRPVTAHSSISAEREEIFDFVLDMGARVAWCDHFMQDLRLTRPRSSGRGAAARFLLDAPFNRGWAETAIVEADRPRRIVEQGRFGRLGRIPGWSVYEFVPQTRGVTRVELTTWTEPTRRVDKLKESLGARGWTGRQAAVALDRLRAVFEERPDAPLARATIAGYEPAKAARFGA